MNKYLVILLIVLLTGCSAPGTALLGPAFTGATTKSIAQASLSFSTNQIIRKIDENVKKSKAEIKNVVRKIDSFDLYSYREKLFHFSR